MEIPKELAEKLHTRIENLLRIDAHWDYCGFCSGRYSTKIHGISHEKDCAGEEFQRLYNEQSE